VDTHSLCIKAAAAVRRRQVMMLGEILQYCISDGAGTLMGKLKVLLLGITLQREARLM